MGTVENFIFNKWSSVSLRGEVTVTSPCLLPKGVLGNVLNVPVPLLNLTLLWMVEVCRVDP